jgi:RepB DNA-primase from phage plasmid
MDALEFLHAVWGKQGKGFVFLSLRTGPNEWLDLSYKYPQDEIEIPDPKDGDVYFCPNMFSRPRRRKELVLPSCWLYADLDEKKPPRRITGSIQDEVALEPTMAWESSPERYQALWHIDKHLDRESHELLNRKLTYALGADKGGWDITQVLRVPGTLNHKYADKPEVKLLWA